MRVSRMVFGVGLLPLLVAAGCARKEYTRLYETAPKAPGYEDDAIANLDHLGSTLVARGVNFGVYSSRATRVELALFDDPESDRPTRRFEMARFGEVWNLYVEGVGVGQAYGFIAWGPNWTYDEDWYCGSVAGFQADVDPAGNRFNPNKLLLDPYALAHTRDHDWSRASLASGPKRAECTWGAAAKALVSVSDYVWSPGETAWRDARAAGGPEGHDWNELVIYEVHPKGFTQDPASGVTHPGTFRGIGENAAYLADLGITAVELLPVHEKPLDGGYWGYWTLNFFAPENTYAATPDPLEVIDEFKEMVDRLHQAGVEVILDVVYNHTGEGGLWRERLYTDDVSLDPGTDGAVNVEPKEIAGIYSYRGLDNAAYYALDADNQTFWNNTGVGNQTRPNHRPTRRLILDSLRFYVEEMHVDGFRFDLAGILGEQDGNYNVWDDPANTVLQDVIDDPVLQAYNTRVIAEPWTAGGWYGPLIGAYPASSNKPGTGWGEWNSRFRDWWRAFVNDDAWRLNSLEADADGGFTLTGSQSYYAWNGRRPYHGVNYVTCHDGMTMYDVVSYNQRQNGCGPLNPICCTQPTSPWCEVDNGEQNNRSRDWGTGLAAEATKRQMMRNLFTATLIAHGTPMILGGDEWMRTQYGNNNAYSTGADNEWNWFRWGDWIASDDRHRMRDFVRDVIRFRKDHAYALAPKEYGGGAPFAWKSPANVDMAGTDWSGKRLMIHYYDPTRGPELAILINMDRTAADFTLPTGKTWRRLVDTQSYFDDPAYLEAEGLDLRASANVTLEAPEVVPGAVYGVQGSSMVILEAEP